jgi:hypothetical protein
MRGNEPAFEGDELRAAQQHESAAIVDSSVADPMLHVAHGHDLSREKRFSEAEVCFRAALALDPRLPIANSNLGWVREMQGDDEGAITAYRAALALQPSLSIAQTNLALLLSRRGQFGEALPLWRDLVARHPYDTKLLNQIIDAALAGHHLAVASHYAAHCAAVRRGSEVYSFPGIDVAPPALPSPEPQLSIGKLRHDIEQFRFMKTSGVLVDEPTEVIGAYERVLETLVSSKTTATRPLNEEERSLIGDVYGRIIYLRPTPLVSGCALSRSWNAAAKEEACLSHPLGIVVIDDFLSPLALQSLRLFCLQSTVWFTNRYAHGRLGAFFREGFNCPLLLQIADELRTAFPRLVGDHRLSQVWGFKYNNQPKTAAHADFAAVNVNFWITPDEANLDKDSGGLVFYDIEAPLSWDFASFNKDGNKIRAFLQ